MSFTAKDASRVTQTFSSNTTAISGQHTPYRIAIPAADAPGLDVYRALDAGTTGAVAKASAGALYGGYFFNAGASIRYLKVYNKATAPTSSDTPVLTIPLPIGGGAIAFGGIGIEFSAGISVRATTGVADNDTGAPGSNEVIINLFYV